MIGIINYGAGNVQALMNCFDRIGVDSKLVHTKVDFQGVSRIILPGVGSFDEVMSRFNNSGLRQSLTDAVVDNKVPILGICVGLQMMFENSEEGKEDGLGFLKGSVKRLTGSNLNEPRLPHIGWNSICPIRDSRLFNLTASSIESRFYFLHSYVVQPTFNSIITATSLYSVCFPVSVEFDNILGVQFHPEKSHSAGLKLLERFALDSRS